MSRPPLSRLPRRFAPLRGTQRRCAALRAAPPGRYAPRALRAQAFWEHRKNAELINSLLCQLALKLSAGRCTLWHDHHDLLPRRSEHADLVRVGSRVS